MTKKASKFYAVRKGKKPGIYNTWPECKKMVDGFKGAQFKSFRTLEEARDYMMGRTLKANTITQTKTSTVDVISVSENVNLYSKQNIVTKTDTDAKGKTSKSALPYLPFGKNLNVVYYAGKRTDDYDVVGYVHGFCDKTINVSAAGVIFKSEWKDFEHTFCVPNPPKDTTKIAVMRGIMHVLQTAKDINAKNVAITLSDAWFALIATGEQPTRNPECAIYAELLNSLPVDMHVHFYKERTKETVAAFQIARAAVAKL